LFKDNVFFVGDAVSSIINFRLRRDDALIAELAYILVEWTMQSDGTLHEAQAEAVLKGYSSVRPLEENERQFLPAFVLAAAARFLTVSNCNDDLPNYVRKSFLSAQTLLRQEPNEVRRETAP